MLHFEEINRRFFCIERELEFVSAYFCTFASTYQLYYNGKHIGNSGKTKCRKIDFV